MKTVYLSLTLTVALSLGELCFAAGVNFDQLVANPKRYNGKQVTITGLADVEGDGFWVWRDGRALKHADVDHAIFIAHEIPPKALFSPYAHANLHWVKVTGIVDTNIHGHLGMDPFSIILQKVEVLPGPRQKQYLPVLAWFRNDTGELLYLDVSVRTGGSSLGVDPHGMNGTAIDASSIAVVSRTRHGHALSKRRLVDSASKRKYYDPDKMAYYYRLTKSTIEPVPPSAARSWKLPPAPDRD